MPGEVIGFGRAVYDSSLVGGVCSVGEGVLKTLAGLVTGELAILPNSLLICWSGTDELFVDNFSVIFEVAEVFSEELSVPIHVAVPIEEVPNVVEGIA